MGNTPTKQHMSAKRKTKKKRKHHVRFLRPSGFHDSKPPLPIVERQIGETYSRLIKEMVNQQKKTNRTKEETVRMNKISTMAKFMKIGDNGRDTWETPYRAWENIITYFKKNSLKPKAISAIDLFFGKEFKQKLWCCEFKLDFDLKQYIEDYRNIHLFRKSLGYNLILTNPPYSQMRECVTYCLKLCSDLDKAFCLLVPEWVMKERWFLDELSSTKKIVTLKPKKRYQYQIRGHLMSNCTFDSLWIMYNIDKLKIDVRNLETKEYVVKSYGDEKPTRKRKREYVDEPQPASKRQKLNEKVKPVECESCDECEECVRLRTVAKEQAAQIVLLKAELKTWNNCFSI